MNNKHFKVETVEQFKILEFINDNFQENVLKLELKDRYTVKATDENGETIAFIYNQHTKQVEYI